MHVSEVYPPSLTTNDGYGTESKGNARDLSLGHLDFPPGRSFEALLGFRAHVREEQHVTDGRRVGQQHDEPVDA